MRRRVFPGAAAPLVLACLLPAAAGASPHAEEVLSAARAKAASGACDAASADLRSGAIHPDAESAAAYHQIALCYTRLRRFTDAEQALAGLDSYPPALYLKAFLAFTLNRYPEAAELASRFLESNPSSGEARKILGLARYMLGDAARAQQELEQAVALLPQDAEAFYYLGRVYFSRNNMPSALEAFQSALALAPHSVRARNHLGQTLEGLSRLEEARAAYRQAIELEQTAAERSEWPYLNLGSLELAEGRTAEAIPHLREALARNPASAQVRVKLARALAETGDGEEAIGHLRKAIELAPGDPEPHYQLGRLLLKAGNAAEGQKHLAEFKRLRAK